MLVSLAESQRLHRHQLGAPLKGIGLRLSNAVRVAMDDECAGKESPSVECLASAQVIAGRVDWIRRRSERIRILATRRDSS